MEQVALVPDQRPIQQLAPAGPHSPFHDRIHARHPYAAEHHLDSCIPQDRVEQLGILAVPIPDQEPRPVARVLEVHDEVLCRLHHPGCGRVRPVAPRIRIWRLPCSIIANTYIGAPDRVTVSKKSQANKASAWKRRKPAQVLQARSGAGWMPASLRISHTVEAATFTPRTSSSPWTRLPPARILPDQTQHEGADGTHRRWPTQPFRCGPGGVPSGAQVAVPAQDRVRADQQPQPT